MKVSNQFLISSPLFVLALGFAASISFAAPDLRKVGDGTLHTCDTAENRDLAQRQKLYDAELNGDLLKVSLKKCGGPNGTTEVLDPSPTRDTYVWPFKASGQPVTVEVSYSDFHLLISNPDGYVIERVKLSGVGAVGSDTWDISAYRGKNIFVNFQALVTVKRDGVVVDGPGYITLGAFSILQ